MACSESFRTTVALDADYRRANKPDGTQYQLPVIVVVGAMLLLVMASFTSSARAATVPLGTLSSFAVLGSSTVTNTGPSVISGSVGVSPGTAVTGFPPGTVIAGTVHAADAVALQAQTDLTTAYDNAFARTGGRAISAPLGGGETLVAGVYTSAADIFVGGDLTLDGGGDANSVFVFQAKTGTLITAAGMTSGVPNTRVLLRNGAQSCNVFWQVGSSATIQTSTQFAGNILALTAISMKTGATLSGRALARNAAVTLDTNRITSAACRQQAPTAPSVTDTAATTETGRPVTIDLSGTDAAGAPLTYVIVDGPSHGTLAPVNQGAATVLYTPSGSYTGPDSFTFQVTSSNGTSRTATVSISITPAIAGATKTPGSGTATMPETGAGGAPKPRTDTGQDTSSGESTGTGDTPDSDSSTVRTGSSGSTSQDTTRSPGLPFTGFNLLWLLLAAAAMLLAGAALRRLSGPQRHKWWAWLR